MPVHPAAADPDAFSRPYSLPALTHSQRQGGQRQQAGAHQGGMEQKTRTVAEGRTVAQRQKHGHAQVGTAGNGQNGNPLAWPGQQAICRGAECHQGAQIQADAEEL